MDLTTVAQQSPFVVVAFAFLMMLAFLLKERRCDRKERAENSQLMVGVIIDNTAAFHKLAASVDNLAGRVEQLEGKHE